MSKRLGQSIGWSLLALLVLFVAYLIWARQTPLAPMAPLPRSAVPAELAVHGRELAQLGNCETCHSVVSRTLYAGGSAVRTQFGSLYGPNITPDPDTGIGRWSLVAFRRALKEGIARDGSHLYPALPYEHFSSLHDDDIAALYAYLMTVPPVHAVAPRNRLLPPIGYRPLLAAWKALYIRPHRFLPIPTSDPVWNQGAYLAESLAHCGSCHNPRNIMGAEKNAGRLSGGSADGWATPPLDGSGKRWTAAQVETYLRRGEGPAGSRARGPMREVVVSFAKAPAPDVHAIAVYIASRMATLRR